MFDLVYPTDPAPVMPAPTADRPSPAVCREEMFPVITVSGEVIGRTARRYCHGGIKLLHPVVHLHLVNRSGEIYLQKRSMKKDIQPGKWDTAVGGHVSYGESIIEALYREASEELGLYDFNPVFLTHYQFESEAETEIVSVFAAVGSFEPHPDMDEVDEGKWWPLSGLEESFGKSVFTPNFEQEFGRIGKSLAGLL